MPNPLIGMIGASVGGAAISAGAQRRAANTAAAAQTQASNETIAEQRRQFDAIRETMAPFIEVGTDAQRQLANLVGLSGDQAQQAALDAINQGPQLNTAIQLGENALLQNASATGGLRGGNTQEALALLRPQLFSQAIDQRYQQLGGLAAAGQSAAAGQGNAGLAVAGNIGNALSQRGQAIAGAALARGQATQNLVGNITGAIGFGAQQFGPRPPGAGLFTRWGF